MSPIYIFIVGILLFLAFFYKYIDPLDIILIVIALVILYITFDLPRFTETFDQTVPLTKTSFDTIQLEEDITDLDSSIVVYNSSFNSKGYNESISPAIWNSLTSSHVFQFSTTPVFSPENGFYLGNNTIIGPECSQLGIDFMSVYTLLLVCKHGNLPNNNPSDIELFKLYATSEESPNGLRFYIAANSIDNSNNVQVGNLQLTYGDQPPQPCRVFNSSDSLINFDRDILTFYFIIKENTSFKIKVFTEMSSSYTKIFDFQPNNTKITLANNNLAINRLENWNANIYTFAVFKSALTDDELGQTYQHILYEYMKYKDPNFSGTIKTYNNAVSTINSITACPFNNATVCNNCSMVHRWYNTNDFINSTPNCKSSINDFCNANKNNQWCQCWDPINSSSTQCKLFKSIFDGNTYLNNLSPDELAEIKKKYGLLDNVSCQSVSNQQQQWQTPSSVNEPNQQDVEVTLPFQDPSIVAPASSKKHIIDYYQKNIMPQNPSKSDSQFDLSGMKIAKDYASQPPQNTNNTSSPYFDKFLKVLMPS